jgi:hypothetical protein
MSRPDVRAQLHAIAAGKAPREEASEVLVDEEAVEKLQPEFRPWLMFADACHREGGERVTAPSELMVPLP